MNTMMIDDSTSFTQISDRHQQSSMQEQSMYHVQIEHDNIDHMQWNQLSLVEHITPTYQGTANTQTGALLLD